MPQEPLRITDQIHSWERLLFALLLAMGSTTIPENNGAIMISSNRRSGFISMRINAAGP
jgi:hypothetical protein